MKLSDATALKLGASDVQAVYAGADLVWNAISGTFAFSANGMHIDASAVEDPAATEYALFVGLASDGSDSVEVYRGAGFTVEGVQDVPADATVYSFWKKTVSAVESGLIAGPSLAVPANTWTLRTWVDGDSNSAVLGDPEKQPGVAAELALLVASDSRYQSTVTSLGENGEVATGPKIISGIKYLEPSLSYIDDVKATQIDLGTNDLNDPLYEIDTPIAPYVISVQDGLIAAHAAAQARGLITIAVAPGEREHAAGTPKSTLAFPEFAVLSTWVKGAGKALMNARIAWSLFDDPCLGAFLDPNYLPSPYDGVPWTPVTGSGSPGTPNNAFYADSIHYAGTGGGAQKIGHPRYAMLAKANGFDQIVGTWAHHPVAPTIVIDDVLRTVTVTPLTGTVATDYRLSHDNGFSWEDFTTATMDILAMGYEIGELRVQMKSKWGNPQGITAKNTVKVDSVATEEFVEVQDFDVIDAAYANVTGSEAGPNNNVAMKGDLTGTFVRVDFTDSIKLILYQDKATAAVPYAGKIMPFNILLDGVRVSTDVTYGAVVGQVIYKLEAPEVAGGTTRPTRRLEIASFFSGAPITALAYIHGVFRTGGVKTKWSHDGGATYSASSQKTGGGEIHDPALAFDGIRHNSGSYTIHTWQPDPGGADQQWLMADLGAARSIDEISVFPCNAGVNMSNDPTIAETGALYGTAYNIQSSPDNVTWTTRATVASTNLWQRTLLSAPISARYWRMIGLKSAQAGSTFLINEMELYG